jgi:uncharacterized membrane protein
MSGTAADPVAGMPSFAAGTVLWAVALLFISIPPRFAPVVRLLGLASALLFGIVAASIFLGAELLPTSKPLPFFAYPFLVMTFIGWIWTLLRERD